MKVREDYRILDIIELILSNHDKRTCYPRPGCVTIRETIFKIGLRLPLHPFLHRIAVLWSYFDPIEPKLIEVDGGVMDVVVYCIIRSKYTSYVFQTVYMPKSPRGGKTKDDIILSSWEAHIPFVLHLSTSIKD